MKDNMAKKSYQALHDELQTILYSFDEATQQDIDNLLKDYERGMKIIEELQARLQAAELRINTVKKDD